MPHNFTRFKLHGRTRRNDEAASRLIGIATDARSREPHFEHAEVAEFHGIAIGERIGNVIERALHHVENLRLNQPRFVADLND